MSILKPSQCFKQQLGKKKAKSRPVILMTCPGKIVIFVRQTLQWAAI